MNGLELRKALSKSKVSIVDLAEKLNMTQPRFKASVSVRMDIASRVRRLAENTALSS